MSPKDGHCTLGFDTQILAIVRRMKILRHTSSNFSNVIKGHMEGVFLTLGAAAGHTLLRQLHFSCRKLFVGGLSWETTQENLSKYFSRFGDVIDCVVRTVCAYFFFALYIIRYRVSCMYVLQGLLQQKQQARAKI